MSNFNYLPEKIEHYAPLVIAYIENNPKGSNPISEGYIKATDGIDYKIDTKKGGKFDIFKSKVRSKEKKRFINLAKWLKDPQNQFKIESDDSRYPDKTQRSKSFQTLGWTQIEKKAFSIGDRIETPQQEQITLLIIKNVLGGDSKHWDSFDEMFEPRLTDPNRTDKPYSEIKEIFPKLRKQETWWNNFNLQFDTITTTNKFPNDSYDVYLYDGKNSFMDYVTNLVTKKWKLYSKKDSWDPADIWLLKRGAKKEFEAFVEGVDGMMRAGSYDSMQDARFQPIREINAKLREMYAAKRIVGISLKKSDGKKLKYDEFNLNADEKSTDLPDVKFDKIQLNCTYDKSTRTFKSKTSSVLVNDEAGFIKKAAYKLAFKSNTGSGTIGNITYEFLPTSKASAFLGKVPKDELKKWLTDQITKEFRGVTQSQGIDMPQGLKLPKTWSKEYEDKLNLKVKTISRNFNTAAFKEFDNKIDGEYTYVSNLYHSYKNGVSDKNSSMMQMVDFVYILALLQEQKQLTLFLTRCYYFAQKKGIKYNFGPFGKLY